MFGEQTEQTNPPIVTFKLALAIALLVIGIGLGFWVLSVVKATIYDEEHPPILDRLSPAYPVVVKSPAGAFELPKEIFMATAYLTLFLFLMIPSTIATRLIAGGISLLKADMKKLVNKLVEALAKANPQSNNSGSSASP